MATVQTTTATTTEIDDPLGYGEPTVVDRLRHMAEDAVNGVNAEAVKTEVAILRARLKGASHDGSEDAPPPPSP